MEVFEQLGPFVRFGQFLALFPFQIKTYPSSGQFERFNFSWYHPITCWFVLMISYQIIPPLLASLNLYVDPEIQSNMLKLPISIDILFKMSGVFHYLSLTVARIVTLRYQRVYVAIESMISPVVNELHCESTPQCTIKKRSVIGIIIIISSVHKFF